MEDWQCITQDILLHPQFQKLRDYRHHSKENSVYTHSVSVSRCAFALCERFGMNREDTVSATRAALLHDFFGYDWHGNLFRRYLRQHSGWAWVCRQHAFIHGPIAAHRAERYFTLTSAEREAISRHMFPLSEIPRSRIAWVVTLADKIVASREVSLALGGHLSLLYRRVFSA